MIFKFIIHCIVLCSLSVAYCEEPWQVEEREVLSIAQKENLPIVAVFLGGNWCPWSLKLDQEVLSTSSFQGSVGKDAMVWLISIGKDENDNAMRQKYGIKECPSIVILDPKGREFARVSYEPISPEQYARQILGLIDDFQEVCIALEEKADDFEEERWINLYLKAKQFSVPCYKQVLLERGMKAERGNFFHLEKWAMLMESRKLKSPEVVKLRKEILIRDPENALGTHFKVAALEFEKISCRLKVDDRPEKAIKPLLSYLHQFGKNDPENRWKAQLMIAEFLASKNSLEKALEFAKASYRSAPLPVKAQIAEAIESLDEEIR
jgi:protein disulfide-isomerase